MSDADPLREALKGASTDIAAASAAEQADLFALPVPDPTGEIEALRQSGSKGGRPKGAQNLATRELRAWLLSRGVLPQQAMMQWLTMGPEGMAKALGCSKLEAFDRWARLAEGLGKYFLAPMTPVDGEGKPAPSFQVFIGGSPGIVQADGTIKPPWEYLNEQNQEVTTLDIERSKSEEQS